MIESFRAEDSFVFFLLPSVIKMPPSGANIEQVCLQRVTEDWGFLSCNTTTVVGSHIVTLVEAGELEKLAQENDDALASDAAGGNPLSLSITW